MKSVLCYGDSNTWGSVPAEDRRFAVHERWPGVLREALGPAWHVVEEGLPGRTSVFDDPIEGRHKNGRAYLQPCLESHWPLDAVVLMLGTNDLKARFGVEAGDIAVAVETLVMQIRRFAVERGATIAIVLICPPPVEEVGSFAVMFAGGGRKSRGLAAAYAEVAGRQGCNFLDAGTVIASSPADGIHLDSAAHATLGRAVAGTLIRVST